jgi:hypothetical protein
MSVSELELDLGTAAMNCTADEVAAALASFLHEMKSVARLLRPDERVALRLIMSRDSGTLTVGEVFRGFSRNSEAHKTLRRLRAAQFVRPAVSGNWTPGERIEVKPFARLLWDRVGEGAIFADDAAPDADADVVFNVPEDADAVFKVAEDANDDAEVVLDAGADDTPMATPAPATKPLTEPLDPEAAAEAAAARIWEEDPVVDLADMDDLQSYAEEELRANKS